MGSWQVGAWVPCLKGSVCLSLPWSGSLPLPPERTTDKQWKGAPPSQWAVLALESEAAWLATRNWQQSCQGLRKEAEEAGRGTMCFVCTGHAGTGSCDFPRMSVGPGRGKLGVPLPRKPGSAHHAAHHPEGQQPQPYPLHPQPQPPQPAVP